ncbi:MAG: DUF169 domain-containing protein [Promethearchaeota archaeon]
MNEEKIYKKNDYRQAGNEIYNKLHLSTYPISIKYLTEGSKDIKGLTKPSFTGKKMSICQAFTMSRTFGISYMITAEDNFCTPSSLAHGWLKLSLEDLIESQIKQGWHKDENSERRRFQNQLIDIEELINKGYIGLACAPLFKTKFIPDTILIYGDGVQLTHIIHALCYEYFPDYVPNSSFEGYAESCSKGGLIPFLTQRPQILLPGAGDRAFAGIQNHELGIGMPAKLIFYVIENLFKSGGFLNLGFPAKRLLASNLREEITPGFELLKKKAEE